MVDEVFLNLSTMILNLTAIAANANPTADAPAGQTDPTCDVESASSSDGRTSDSLRSSVDMESILLAGTRHPRRQRIVYACATIMSLVALGLFLMFVVMKWFEDDPEEAPENNDQFRCNAWFCSSM